MSYSTDVKAFLDKFGLECLDSPGIHPQFEMRHQHLLEEVNELQEAVATNNIPEVIDALLDVVYIALGTAHLCGYNVDAHWAEIQRANMSKVRGTTKRGSSFDVAKPHDWIAPRHTNIIGE